MGHRMAREKTDLVYSTRASRHRTPPLLSLTLLCSPRLVVVLLFALCGESSRTATKSLLQKVLLSRAWQRRATPILMVARLLQTYSTQPLSCTHISLCT